MNIIIKCKLYDSLDVYKYKIKIYDELDNLLISDYTNEYGRYEYNVTCFGLYKIVVCNYMTVPNKKCIFLYVNRNYSNELFIIFNEKNKLHSITVNMTDQNYVGLPIKEGKIILCQK